MPDETKPDNTNMRIWDELFQVPKGSTYPIERGLCAGLTGITPLSLIKQATELWGPIGEGWGFEIEKDEIVNQDAKFHSEMLHVMTIKLWYGEPAMQMSTPCTKVTYGMGCTRMYRWLEGEWFIDPDYNKSTLTDAITNALSRLGSGGSVRLGDMQSKYTTNLDAKGDELEKAWAEHIVKFKEANHGLRDWSDAKIIEHGVAILQDNSRSITPEHVGSLIKK